MWPISLQEDANSLLYELNLCEIKVQNEAPEVAAYKNEIFRMKLEAQNLIRKAVEMEMPYCGQRRWCSQKEIDDLSAAIQRLRNNILFFKSNLEVYKKWYRKDSPQSDRYNYSSPESGADSPFHRTNYGRAKERSAFNTAIVQPSRSHVQNRYSHFPSQTQTQTSYQSSCSRCSRGSYCAPNNFFGHCLCWMNSFNPFSSLRTQTPQYYAYPARPSM